LHDSNLADTSRAARESAVQSIPMSRLSTDARAKATWVLANTSVFRRLPVRAVPCDPEFYLFLVQHPDVVVNIWEILGVGKLTVRQTAPGAYQVTDEIGTTGQLHFLYRSHDTNVIYVEGAYQGSMFPQTIRARGLIVLKSGYVQEANGRCFVTSRLDSFLNIEPGGVEFLTKTFQPLVGKVADNNFIHAAGFLASLSRTAEVNNEGMQRLSKKLTKVQPEVRRQFAELSEQVSQRAAAAGRSGATPARSAASPARAEAAKEAVREAGQPKLAQRPAPADARSVRPSTTSAAPSP
jgi:hypothetical protein